MIGHLLPHNFQQFGHFRAQFPHLHGGPFVAQSPQESSQNPRAGGIESLDARTVDDHP